MTQNDKKFIEQSQRGGITLANGARYQHLVAVWLLVCEAVESIALETENDIAYPPGDKFSVYVQVKHRADDQMWNSTSLTASDENIFRLFRINAEKNPEAELWFVTDTAVDTSPLDELKAELYANNPNAKNRDVMKRLQAQGLEASPKTAQLIDRLVIKKLMTYEFLTVAIERTLLAQGFAPDRTFGILNGMVGFTLEIGRQLNLSDRVLSRIELYQKCVGISPPQAFTFAELLGYCNQMVSRVRQERPQTAWNEAVFVSRESFVETFELFTQSPDPLFVLAGESGRGKSFICSWLAEEYLKGCLRVLWNAADLTPDKPILNALIEELNPRVDVQQDAPRWLERLSGYAATTGKPFFILIDEINRADDVRNFKNILLQAVRQIEGHNLKLFVTCRTQAWESLAQETDFQRYVFVQQPNDELGRTPTFQSQDQPHTPEGAVVHRAQPFSYQLMPYTDTEFEVALERYLAPRRINLEIRGRARELLRHPLYLRLFCESLRGPQTGRVQSIEGEVLEAMISNMLRQISQETGIATATVNEFISVTAMSIAQNREASTSRREVMLETGFSREMVDQLVEHCIEIGLLAAVETASGYVRFIVEEFFNRLSQTDILSD